MKEKPNKTVYLAGKITGDPHYKSKFSAAAAELEKAGFVVLSPAILPPEGFEYDAYIRMSGAMLAECDAICFLSDWRGSPGAQSERAVAEKFGKEMFHFDDFKSKPKSGAKRS